jgi:hypothetical protein
MNSVFEGGHHAEVAAPAAKTPEEIVILFGARLQKPAVRGYDVG